VSTGFQVQLTAYSGRQDKSPTIADGDAPLSVGHIVTVPRWPSDPHSSAARHTDAGVARSALLGYSPLAPVSGLKPPTTADIRGYGSVDRGGEVGSTEPNGQLVRVIPFTLHTREVGGSKPPAPIENPMAEASGSLARGCVVLDDPFPVAMRAITHHRPSPRHGRGLRFALFVLTVRTG